VRTVLAALAVLAWFALSGLLWFMRPPDALWLLGSAILGVLFFGGFFWYLMKQDERAS
jgi:hypothetical protein